MIWLLSSEIETKEKTSSEKVDGLPLPKQELSKQELPKQELPKQELPKQELPKQELKEKRNPLLDTTCTIEIKPKAKIMSKKTNFALKPTLKLKSDDAELSITLGKYTLENKKTLAVPEIANFSLIVPLNNLKNKTDFFEKLDFILISGIPTDVAISSPVFNYGKTVGKAFDYFCSATVFSVAHLGVMAEIDKQVRFINKSTVVLSLVTNIPYKNATERFGGPFLIGQATHIGPFLSLCVPVFTDYVVSFAGSLTQKIVARNETKFPTLFCLTNFYLPSTVLIQGSYEYYDIYHDKDTTSKNMHVVSCRVLGSVFRAVDRYTDSHFFQFLYDNKEKSLDLVLYIKGEINPTLATDSKYSLEVGVLIYLKVKDQGIFFHVLYKTGDGFGISVTYESKVVEKIYEPKQEREPKLFKEGVGA